MSELPLPFSIHTIEDWQAQLQSELLEKSHLLNYINDVEELEFSITDLEGPQIPMNFNSPTNWKNLLKVSAEAEKKTNQLLLAALMQGAEAVIIEHTSQQTDWTILLNDIHTAYIDCMIIFNDDEALQQFKNKASEDAQKHCKLLYQYGEEQNYFSSFKINQVGANCATELGSLLLNVHRVLELQSSSESNIHVHSFFVELGLGADYFVEIAKFTAIRKLIEQLSNIHQKKIEIKLLATTGFCNKSLHDPYTNLLRQTTESMSAIIGAAEYLCVQPYDALSTNGTSEFAQRMALNIGNLLQYEAKLDQTKTLLFGSYVIGKLTQQLIEKSWKMLCDLEEESTETNEHLKSRIIHTRSLRLQKFKDKKLLLTGINCFENEFEIPSNSWGNLPTEIGIPFLIYEKTMNNA